MTGIGGNDKVGNNCRRFLRFGRNDRSGEDLRFTNGDCEPQRRKDAEKEREESRGIGEMTRLVTMVRDSSTSLGMTEGESE